MMRWILVGTAAIWVVLELPSEHRLTDLSGRMTASWRSEVLFRLIVGVGALDGEQCVCGWHSRAHDPSATPPSLTGVGLVLFWCGIDLCGSGAFTHWVRYFTYTVPDERRSAGRSQRAHHADLGTPATPGCSLCHHGVGLFIGNWLSLVCLTRRRLPRRALCSASEWTAAGTHAEPLGDSYRPDYRRPLTNGCVPFMLRDDVPSLVRDASSGP